MYFDLLEVIRSGSESNFNEKLKVASGPPVKSKSAENQRKLKRNFVTLRRALFEFIFDIFSDFKLEIRIKFELNHAAGT